jgi:signal transduction histidine kinase
MSQQLLRRMPVAAQAPDGGDVVAARPAGDVHIAVRGDRRIGVERIIELSRWVVLVFAAITNNLPGIVMRESVGAVNLLLGGWALYNLCATVLLLAHRLPGRRLQFAAIGLDIAMASALVYLSGGFASNLGMAFYMVVIASSLRFGIAGTLTCALAAGGAYFFVGVASAQWQITEALLDVAAMRLFLFFVVALTSGLLARELVAARARELRHTFELQHAAFNELREVDRIKSDFMMLASHELRTPLTKIKAWLALMQDTGDRLPPEARDQGLVELRMEAEHLARLTDNLLCITQLESGEIRLKTTEVDLDTVVHEVISRFVETADRGRFAIRLDEDAKRLLADHERLALVLACLIDNALKFSPMSEPVRIRARRVVNKVHIEVRDNGRRIPDSDKERVFASFYQVESPLLRQRGGFGVGLYLARQLVERMGGSIAIDNSKPRGNKFVVALPAFL